MKMIKVIVVVFLIALIYYVFHLVIGMSSTYPSIKKYSFGVNKGFLEQKLADRINSSSGWSMEKKDSIKGENEICYWTSLLYDKNGQKFEYDIKYCLDSITTQSGFFYAIDDLTIDNPSGRFPFVYLCPNSSL